MQWLNTILLTIVLSLTILILLWIFAAIVLRKLGMGCLSVEEKKEDLLDTPIINMNDVHMDYSFEMVQPEMNDPSDCSMYDKPRTKKRLFENIMSSQADSADEMSFIYDMYSETETDQLRKTKAISARFAKYLENVPGIEPVMLISLHYNRDDGQMVLAIIKVANLTLLLNNKKPDPYVRVDVWVGNIIKFKKKTIVMKQEHNPVFNQKMAFHVSATDLQNVKIILTVANYTFSSLLGSPRPPPVPLYEVMFGEQATGSFHEHWKATITSNKPIAKWHLL